MGVEDIHLREGEISELYNYLKSFRKNRSHKEAKRIMKIHPEIKGLDGEIRKLTKEYRELAREFKVDTQRVRNREISEMYEDESSYGKNFKQIFENARAHFRICSECRNQYKNTVQEQLDYVCEQLPSLTREMALPVLDVLKLIGKS